MRAPVIQPGDPVVAGDRDPRWPLVLGLVVAVVLHAGLLPVLVMGYGTGVSKRLPRMADVEEPPLPPRDEPMLGRDTLAVSTMSWISHEDYRQLIAPQAESEQPALQETVDPVAEAPPVLDATPPTPVPQPEAQPPIVAAEREPTPTETPPDAAPQPDQTPVEQRVSGPLTPDTSEPGELAMSEPPELAATAPTPTSPESTPTPAAAPSPESKPTSAARDEQTVDPTSLTDSDLELRSGNVLVGQGIEITTARPDITVITALFASGIRDTRVEMKFNGDGLIDQARLLRSTGLESVDAAVLASLYKWRASGEMLKSADPHITVTLDYRFSRPR